MKTPTARATSTPSIPFDSFVALDSGRDSKGFFVRPQAPPAAGDSARTPIKIRSRARRVNTPAVTWQDVAWQLLPYRVRRVRARSGGRGERPPRATHRAPPPCRTRRGPCPRRAGRRVPRTPAASLFPLVSAGLRPAAPGGPPARPSRARTLVRPWRLSQISHDVGPYKSADPPRFVPPPTG